MIRLREVLLVDDSEADNYIHRRVIQKSGVVETVSVARNGQEALDHLAPTAALVTTTDTPENTAKYVSWHDFYSYCCRAYGIHLAVPRRRRLQKELRVTRSGRINYKAFCAFLGADLSADQLGMVPMNVEQSNAISG